MSSSKFSSPFFKKSPLLGAYGSGADSIVTVSDLPHYQKLQQDLVAGTLATFTPEAIGNEQLKKADRRDARVAKGGSKLKQFLDKNKLGFLTANYTKDTNKDGVTDYKEKTNSLRASGKAKIDNAQRIKNAKNQCANGVDRITSAGTVICNK
jgi:hypothetical protein